MASAKEKAEEAADSVWLQALARTGLVAYGVVWLLIGWLALQLAWGRPSSSPDPSGAFRAVAEQPLGRVLLILIALVLGALSLWQASEAVWGNRNFDGADRVRERVRSGLWSAIYIGFGGRAAWVAVGPAAARSDSRSPAPVGVLAWPGGRAIVVVTGLVIIGVGFAAAIRGVRKSFSDEMDTSSLAPTTQKALLNLGRVGYVTKGVALGLAGGLLAYAAWTFDLQKASGLDAALQTILQQPFGRWLLSAMAFGFEAFGVFAVLLFRYRRM